MCLGVPARIIELDPENKWAVIDSYGVHKKINIFLIDEELNIGDYLMVHAGYAIGKLDVEEARQTLALLEKISLV